jgi:CheY-like chemotaxis protein
VGEYVSGAGLGLSICKELIEQHGGVLEIQSPPSGMMRGARVAMRVPVAVPAVVLTMCDEDGLAGRIRRALESCGYKVVGARLEGDPEQALKDAKPDLVVLDWSAGGFEVAGLISAIKRNEAYRQIPLIVVTGGEPGSIKQEIIQGFGLAEVRQPWTDEELCVRLDQMILGRKDFIV